jgi:phage major head subunit gpT-like protein
MIINQTNLADLFKGYKLIFQNAFNGVKNDYEQIAMVVPSSTSKEVYPWLGSTTRFREWIGARVLQNLMTHDFTIKNKSWENTVTVDREAIEDDTYGIFKPMFEQLGQDAKKHPNELIFSLLSAGFSSLCFDGQYFFDTDHPVMNEDGSISSVSNFGGGSGPAWFLLDTSRFIKPIIYQVRKDYNFVAKDKETDDNVFDRKEYVYGVDGRSNVGFGLWQLAFASKQPLTPENYDAARTAMLSMRGDNGKPLGVNPCLLVVRPSQESAAKKILQAEKNDAGATNIYQNTAQLLSTPWLS